MLLRPMSNDNPNRTPEHQLQHNNHLSENEADEVVVPDEDEDEDDDDLMVDESGAKSVASMEVYGTS